MSSMRFHPTGRGHEDDEDGQEGCSTTAKRISYWTDRRLTGLAGPDYAATISFGLPLEPEDSQYGKSRLYMASGRCLYPPTHRPRPYQHPNRTPEHGRKHTNAAPTMLGGEFGWDRAEFRRTEKTSRAT